MGVTPHMPEDPDAPIPPVHAARRHAARRAAAPVARGGRGAHDDHDPGRPDDQAPLRAGDPRRASQSRAGRLRMVRGHGRRRPRLPRVEDRRRRAGPAAPPARPGDPGQAAPRRRPEHPARPHVHLPGRGDRHRREARWRQQRRVAARGLPGCEDRPELRLRDRCRPPGRRVPLGQGRSPGRGTLRARALGRRRRPASGSTAPAADGRRSFFDTDVAAGQSIRYKVFALAGDGRIVGVSRVDTVLVPTIATP